MNSLKKGILDAFNKNFPFGVINVKDLIDLFDAKRISKVINILNKAGLTIMELHGEQFVVNEELAELFAVGFGEAGYRGSFYPQFIYLPRASSRLKLKINGLKVGEVNKIIKYVYDNPEKCNIQDKRGTIDHFYEKG